MAPRPPDSIAAIIAQRTGEEMALNDRYLNPQMGRILRTLGFDKVWTGGEGSNLIDERGERYPDFSAGYAAFGMRRHHPAGLAPSRLTVSRCTTHIHPLAASPPSSTLSSTRI